nr:ribonuclease H-like domain-containing protein [Tanacetum cinerariifolium]
MIGSTASSSSTQNMAFVSSKSTSSTNEASTAYGVSTSSGHNSQREGSSSYTGELMYSLFANQSSGGHDFHETKEVPQKDRKKVVVNKAKDNERRPRKQEEPKALVTLDGDGIDWTGHSEDEEQLGDASIDIQAYDQALKKVEAQLVAHQKNQLWYEKKIRFMEIDLDDKTDVLTYHKKLLVEAEKEKEELKAKIEKWQNSSKGLNNVLDSQMSAKDKYGLGSSDIEDSPINDRYAEGMHAVPPPMTGIYMPPRSNVAIDDVETLESVPKPVANEPKVVSKPKVWSDAPIIEEYESDSDDEHVTIPLKEQEKPRFAFVNIVKHVKTPRPKNNVYNSHSPIKSPFSITTAPKDNFSYHKVNTDRDKIVSVVGGNRKNVVKASADYDLQKALKNKGIVDSGCSMHMTENKAYLVDYQDYNGGHVAFGGSKGHITGKGKIRTGKLDFEDVCFVKELQHFNLFSVSQMCDKKNKNIVPTGGLACLIAKATVDKSNKWHRRKESNTRPPVRPK